MRGGRGWNVRHLLTPARWWATFRSAPTSSGSMSIYIKLIVRHPCFVSRLSTATFTISRRHGAPLRAQISETHHHKRPTKMLYHHLTLALFAAVSLANPLPDNTDLCSTVKCKSGTECAVVDGRAQCEPSEGEQCGSATCSGGTYCCNSSCS